MTEKPTAIGPDTEKTFGDMLRNLYNAEIEGEWPVAAALERHLAKGCWCSSCRTFQATEDARTLEKQVAETEILSVGHVTKKTFTESLRDSMRAVEDSDVYAAMAKQIEETNKPLSTTEKYAPLSAEGAIAAGLREIQAVEDAKVFDILYGLTVETADLPQGHLMLTTEPQPATQVAPTFELVSNPSIDVFDLFRVLKGYTISPADRSPTGKGLAKVVQDSSGLTKLIPVTTLLDASSSTIGEIFYDAGVKQDEPEEQPKTMEEMAAQAVLTPGSFLEAWETLNNWPLSTENMILSPGLAEELCAYAEGEAEATMTLEEMFSQGMELGSGDLSSLWDSSPDVSATFGVPSPLGSEGYITTEKLQSKYSVETGSERGPCDLSWEDRGAVVVAERVPDDSRAGASWTHIGQRAGKTALAMEFTQGVFRQFRANRDIAYMMADRNQPFKGKDTGYIRENEQVHYDGDEVKFSDGTSRQSYSLKSAIRNGWMDLVPTPGFGENENVYTVETSGAAFTFTLPKATGSLERHFYITGEVTTNAITLTVQEGETLNSLQDGSLTLTEGAQKWQALDCGEGAWQVSLLGSGPAEGKSTNDSTEPEVFQPQYATEHLTLPTPLGADPTWKDLLGTRYSLVEDHTDYALIRQTSTGAEKWVEVAALAGAEMAEVFYDADATFIPRGVR